MIRAFGRKYIKKVLIGFGRHLIFAEGTKTEVNYVQNIKSDFAIKLNVDPTDVEIIPVHLIKSKHTLDLVDYAREDVEKRRISGETIDHVWIFYDKDEFNDFDETYKRIRLLNNKPTVDGETPCDEHGTQWHACWSNECFEVWLYHYFENLVVPMDRKEYIKRINGFLKRNGCKESFEKNIENPHTLLISGGGSIDRAYKLMKQKDVDGDVKPNPSSGVYLFIEYIKKYLDNKNDK